MKLFTRRGLGCDDVGKLSDAYVDRELDAFDRRQVFQHLGACEPCSARVAAKMWMKSRVRASVHGLAVPPALIESVCRNIGS